MIQVMVTRFNNLTWNENCRWRERNSFDGCIYNSPIHIKDEIPLMINIYVIEMNNETNKIMGIGKIINKVYTDKKYSIYEEKNYNRYTYRGKQRISRESIKEKEKLEKMENKLFKSKSHLKRGQGITQVSYDINREYLLFIISEFTNNSNNLCLI